MERRNSISIKPKPNCAVSPVSLAETRVDVEAVDIQLGVISSRIFGPKNFDEEMLSFAGTGPLASEIIGFGCEACRNRIFSPQIPYRV
jgi:hypothetical protein